MNLPNRNYLLRFRNMKNPERIIVKSDGQDTPHTHKIEKKDLIIELKYDVKCGILEKEVIKILKNYNGDYNCCFT